MRNDTNTGAQRDASADLTKGLAIILMVYGHINQIGYLKAAQDELVGVIYTLHMPIFLILSGYFFNGMENPRQGIQRIVSRLLRPYLIFSSLYLIALVVTERLFELHTANASPQTLQEFFETLLLKPKGGYWFIHTLIVLQLCLCFGALLARTTESAKRAYGYALVLFAVLSGIVSDRSAVFFIVGMTMSQRHVALPRNALIGGALMAAAWLYGSHIPYAAMSLPTIAWAFGAMLIAVHVGSALTAIRPFRLFAWLGRNSLAILLLHAALLQVFKFLAPAISRGEPSGVLYAALATLGTCLGSALSFKLLDRIKLTPWIMGVERAYSPL